MGHPGEWIHHEGAGIEYDTGIGRLRIRACLEYSTDIASAWQVVEKMQTSLPHILIDVAQRSDDGTYEGLQWSAYLRKIDGENHNYFASAETAPLAICRAALLAVMELDK